MGRLGYQSEAQSALDVSYNSVADYSRSMRIGLTKSYPDYAAIRHKEDQQHPQLNDAVLQIENEFYGTIRPKRTTRSGERPLAALNERGVEYVEVRCVDLNPFEPLGINAEQIRFLDTFLLLCLLAPSPPDSAESRASLSRNQTRVVERGREPGLQLETDTGLVALADWARQLLEACDPIVEALDRATRSDARDYDSVHEGPTDTYGTSLQTQKDKVSRPAMTPSAKVIAAMAMHGSFFEFTMHQAQEIQRHLQAIPVTQAAIAALQKESADSLRRQAEVEAADIQTFEEFLEDYLALP